MRFETELQELEQVEIKSGEENIVVLFNDEVNTFDFVIDSLIEVCEHDPIQAEQCTNIVHYSGKCDVKHGSRNKLTPICNELLRRGLTAEIH